VSDHTSSTGSTSITASTGSTTSPTNSAGEPTIGELMSRLSDQTSRLIRDEIRLAQVETSAKVKHGIMGVAEFGVAGVLALYGVGLLLATAVLGLNEALPAWLAALIVTVVVLAGAAVAALLGKKEVAEVGPVAPEKAVAGVKEDVATLKGGNNHE
jgi:hypothetical protein